MYGLNPDGQHVTSINVQLGSVYLGSTVVTMMGHGRSDSLAQS